MRTQRVRDKLTDKTAWPSRRMRREARTVETMIRLYCADLHHPPRGELCPDCAALLDYALKRLRRCPFQEGKTTCGRCPVHCYQGTRREAIREVMRHAGPRMLPRHPLMALMHAIDGQRRHPRGWRDKTRKRQQGDVSAEQAAPTGQPAQAQACGHGDEAEEAQEPGLGFGQ